MRSAGGGHALSVGLQNAARAIGAFTAACIGISSALAATVEHLTGFGKFDLVEEVRTRDPGEPPIMHVATEWTKYHLRWRSSDNVVRFALTDDGEQLSASFEGRECSSRSAFQQFSGKTGEPILFDEALKQLGQTFEVCPRVSAAERQHYAREFALSADDFVPAVEALKLSGAKKFGSWRNRCIDRAPGFDPFAPCIQPKQKKN